MQPDIIIQRYLDTKDEINSLESSHSLRRASWSDGHGGGRFLLKAARDRGERRRRAEMLRGASSRGSGVREAMN